MQDLISINQKEFNGREIQTTTAKELYLAIGLNPVNWARWYASNIENNPFAIKDEDWWGFFTMKNGNETPDAAITVDFAKRLAMTAKTQKGEDVRNYFISCEKKSQRFQIPQTFSAALRLAGELQEQVEQLQLEAKESAPKVEFAMAVRRMEGACKIGDFGKVIGIGQNKLFQKLRDDYVLQYNNLPYQIFIDREYFVVIEQTPYTDRGGKSHPTFTTMVTGKGQVWLEKKYRSKAV